MILSEDNLAGTYVWVLFISSRLVYSLYLLLLPVANAFRYFALNVHEGAFLDYFSFFMFFDCWIN